MPDITFTLTAPQINRLQVAVGVAKGLETAGTPRDATSAEVKTYFVEQMRALVQSVERQKAMKQATDAVTPPANFDPA